MTNYSDNIEIKLFEPQMKSQVAILFHLEYHISEDEFEKFMSRLYEHAYQKDKCILIVATDSNKVVGFQSYFYWPYYYNNRKYNSFQSGNSLVHPEYRGKKLFARMLSFLNENSMGNDIDFLMGFPVDASLKSFIKNGWTNLFNLQWYMKFINPLAFLFSPERLNKFFTKTNELIEMNYPDFFSLSEDAEFRSWKNQLVYKPEQYFQFVYTADDNIIIFDLKFQVRNKIVFELVIGNIRYKNDNSTHFLKAFDTFLKIVKQSMCVSIISFAVNEKFNKASINNVLRKWHFSKINKKIYFILKPLKSSNQILNASIWNVGRADVDTW